MFKYAAVIVTYNRKNKLKKEIESLLVQKRKPEKIIVVDNYSDDGTKEFMERLLTSTVGLMIVYKRLDGNFGGSRGFYEGIQIAMKLQNVDWIALGDDDISYDQSFFENISSASQNHEDILCFTGKVSYPNGELQLEHRRKLISLLTLKQKNIAEKTYLNDFYIDIFSFVGVVINRRVIQQIKLPEKDYFIWCDDTEYALRVRKLTKILNVSGATVYHDTVKILTDRYQPTWKSYYGKRNTILMTKKHSKHPLYYNTVIPFLFMKDMSTLFLKYKYYHPFIKSTMLTYIYAYKDGIKGKKGRNERFMPEVK